MPVSRKRIKIVFIGGGSQMWGPTLVRDIACKKGVDKLDIDLVLLDLDVTRAQTIKGLFDIKFPQWGVDWVKIRVEEDADRALESADFVLIAISTGRLESMRHDLEVPERYGIYHTVGDTSGPGGWSRALRNIPVFKEYARKIKRLCPNAFVMNYTNPMAMLTQVLADELGRNRVIGLCHEIAQNYWAVEDAFEAKKEEIKFMSVGINHFFFITSFHVGGEDGYQLLKEKLKTVSFSKLIGETGRDPLGWTSPKALAAEMFDIYGLMSCLGDRHTCEFLPGYITNKAMLEKYDIVRTSIEDREKMYADAGDRIDLWRNGKEAPAWGFFTNEPSEEIAADVIRAVALDEDLIDVVNTVNTGQISNLPLGAVVETTGCVNAAGVTPLAMGSLPEPIAAMFRPHSEIQLRTVEAGLTGDLNGALLALMSDPVCGHLSPNEVIKMGMELLQANKQYLPQFFAD